MHKTLLVLGGLVTCAFASSSLHAAPGLDEIVYGASVEPGVTEFESRYGRLTGDSADGQDALVLELSHGFSSRFYGAALAIFEREPKSFRKLEAFALEGIVPLGRIKPIGVDAAVYVEVEVPIQGTAKLESKLLLEKRFGAFDSRLNVIAERRLEARAPLEFRYAASADFAIADEIRIGAEAFGDFGTAQRLTSKGDLFVGPSLAAGLEHVGPGELELRVGYLFAIGRAQTQTDGQLRVGLAYEF